MSRMVLLSRVVMVGVLALALEGCSGCAYLSGEYACERDENCPFERVCRGGVCVDESAPFDAAGVGEGEGEGEGCPEHVREGDHDVETIAALEALRPPDGECLVIEGDLEVGEVGSLEALDALVRVGGDLVLEDLDAEALLGLERLASVGGALRVRENDELHSLDALERLRAIGGDLEVRFNRELPACEAYELRDQLTSFGGALLVAENQGSCEDGAGNEDR